MDYSKCDLLHEFLNNLTVIIGQCELLRDETCADANLRLTIISERAHHMTEIIRHHECIAPPHAPRREGFIRAALRALAIR